MPRLQIPGAVTEAWGPAWHLGLRGMARTSGVSHQEVDFNSLRGRTFQQESDPKMEGPSPVGMNSLSLQLCRQRRGCYRRDSSIRWRGRRDFWNPEEGHGFLKLYPSSEGTDAGGWLGGTWSHPCRTGQLWATR